MAKSPSTSYLYTLLFIISSFLLVSQLTDARSLDRKLERAPLTAKGLSYDYYTESCPLVETIVRNHLQQVFAKDRGLAPSILRLFFHDCFSSGCHASILLNFLYGELIVSDNQGFRPEVLETLENLRALIHNQCLRVVSCSDILILAAREAVHQFGGPNFDVPLGRRDSLTFNKSSVHNLPSVNLRTGQQLELYAKKNFDATDLVALSGAHTYGKGHCGGLENRTRDETQPIDPNLKNYLLNRCKNQTNRRPLIPLDIRTPHKFDNMYYIDLLNNQGVFTSDQDLATDPRTRKIVSTFASNEDLFFEKFASAFVKVSQLDVLTGDEGEIRKSCFATNSDSGASSSI